MVLNRNCDKRFNEVIPSRAATYKLTPSCFDPPLADIKYSRDYDEEGSEERTVVSCVTVYTDVVMRNINVNVLTNSRLQ